LRIELGHRGTGFDGEVGQVVFEIIFNYTSFVVADDFLLNSRKTGP
jgi:hypothetical protein